MDPSPSPCPNCGTLGNDQYCPHCGQHRADVRTSVRRLVRDVLEDQLSVNSTLPRTMRALFLHPGKLTSEYLDGRIASYIPPFRLYLISSLMFFVLLSFVSRRQPVDLTAPPTSAPRRDSAVIPAPSQSAEPAGPDTLDVFLRVGTLRLGLNRGASTFADAIEMDFANEKLENALRVRLRALDPLPPQEASQRLVRSLIQQAPKVVFLLLPAYAFLLYLLYLRRKRYYVEHFVFALHVHAFAFFVFILIFVLSRNLFIFLPLILWLPVYTYLAMKRVYGQGWVKTFMKWGVLGFAYLILFAFSLFFTFIAAVFAL